MLYYLGCLALGTALCAYCIKIAMGSEAQVKREMLLREQLHRTTENYMLEVARKYAVMRQRDVLQMRLEDMHAQRNDVNAQAQAQGWAPHRSYPEGVFEIMSIAE